MPIKFEEALVYNANASLSIEDVYRLRGEFGAIHAFEFDDLVNDPFTTLDEWTDPRSVWAILSETAIASASGAAWEYGELWSDYTTPSSFKIIGMLHENAGEGSCLIFRGDGSETYYVLEINSTSCGFYYVEDGVSTALSVLPETIYTPAKVELTVWQQQYSKEANDRYLFMTFSLDGRTILSASHHIPLTVPGLYWGLGVKSTGVSRWDSVRIPDLSDIVIWTSLDPGETPMASIKRAVGDRVLSQLVRREALRAWKPKAQAVDYVIPAKNIRAIRPEFDSRELISHVRMQYASGWVDVFDEDLLAAYGHHFREVYNADIYHEDEAYNEGLAVLRRAKEQATRCSIQLVGLGFLLEPEDRIQLPDSSTWLIDSVSCRIQQHVQTTIRARYYVFN